MSSYVLSQYNYNGSGQSQPTFMTCIKDGQPADRIYPTQMEEGQFYDERVVLVTTSSDGKILSTTSLSDGKNYYLHVKIKQMASPQIFKIKLINTELDGAAADTSSEQYLKTVTVNGGVTDLDIEGSGWTDIELVFTPFKTFNTILFELQRTVDDYRVQTRYPIIMYEELSEINNIITDNSGLGLKNNRLIKVGVQSRPGFLMCINGEEIRTGRTGIYELKNSVITVGFFSAVSAGDETTNVMKDMMRQIDLEWDATKDLDPDPGESGISPQEEARWAITSKCVFNQDKTRKISNFTLDYMYREEVS